MTAEKQLQALKWVAATFGGSIVGLVIWGATLTADVKQLRGEVTDLWAKYNEAEKEKTGAMAEFAAFKQEIRNMKEAAENEQKNEFLKLFFNKNKSDEGSQKH